MKKFLLVIISSSVLSSCLYAQYNWNYYKKDSLHEETKPIIITSTEFDANGWSKDIEGQWNSLIDILFNGILKR